MNKKTLLNFIAKAHRHTYAGPKEIKIKYKCKQPILIGHKDYHFEEGDFAYHDSYAGKTWAPGREVVFFKNNPIWSMGYQGRTFGNFDENFFQDSLFPFLQKALRTFKDEMPFRGPDKFEEKDFKYTFEMKGDYEYFTGQEKVYFRNEIVFLQDIIGSKIE